MSMDITNPYTPNLAPSEMPFEKRPLQGFTKVVCIFFIILGSLGLLQALGAGIQFLVAMAAAANAPDQAMLNVGLPGAFAISVVFAVINGGVSIFEIIAGVLGLQQKRSGATYIRLIAAFMMLLKVVETTFGVVQGIAAFGQVKEKVMADLQAKQNGPGPEVDMGAFLEIGMYVGIGFVVLMGLAMFLFYLFTFLHFSKQKTIAQFS